MSDWHSISKGADLNIPEDAVARIAPILDGLHAAFRPLLTKIPFNLDPAITLSEEAVKGE
jgi:hypothetical protein